MPTGFFKDRLMGALHSAVQNFNQDNDPNGAVVKAARDNDFNTDQTQRLVEMFNTARTLYHYKRADDRTQEFALADMGSVLSELFTDEKKSEIKAADIHSYSEYDIPERCRHAQTFAEKAAAVPMPQDSGLTLDQVAAQAMRSLRDLRQTSKIASDEARIAGAAAATALTKLARGFSTGVKEDNEDRYARLVTAYGKCAEWMPVVDQLAVFVPAKDKAPAAVMAKYARDHVIDDRDLGLEMDLMKEARDWMEAEAELTAAAGICEKEADAFERDYLEALQLPFTSPAVTGLADFIRPEVVKAAQTTMESKYDTRNLMGDIVTVSSKKQMGSGGEPGAGIRDAVSGAALEGLKRPAMSMLETGVERAFTAPVARQNTALSERLKNVQRQIMLQDLMTNDPVLAEEAPETVAEAYNAILQLAPEMASNKEVVRAVLRQTIHSVAVSPYDAETWTKLEKNLRNIRGKDTGGREVA